VTTAEAVMPAAFIGHGNPMNALERNRFTEAWRALGASVPRPAAVVAVSAHWYINATAVTAMPSPRTIHDFFGFPRELFDFTYAAPGSADVAEEVVRVAEPVWVGLDVDSWGIDHGTWSVLAHMFPEADVPVVQLSINALLPHEYHLELGRRLAPLRQQGVMIVASGNVVHNLGRVDPRRPDRGFDWAQRFDREATALLTDSPVEMLDLRRHPDFLAAVPTPDHYLPCLYLAGLADEAGATAEVLVDGCIYGSLSMTSYVLGLAPGALAGRADVGRGVPSPGPDDVPAVATNI
jgi:4,5-DOPA dioxygenase extradiol